jgi:hypothetical protein
VLAPSRLMSSGWVFKPFETDESPDPSLAVDVSGQGSVEDATARARAGHKDA